MTHTTVITWTRKIAIRFGNPVVARGTLLRSVEMVTAMDRASICDFINRQRYGVVSSIADDGTPQSALVAIACTSELDIVFDTLNGSRKYGNLRKRPACSIVVGWSGEQTLQLEGVAEVPRGGDLTRFQEEYFLRWPDGRVRLKWQRIAYFVVRPSWLRYSDFDRNPPFIQEITREMILSGILPS